MSRALVVLGVVASASTLTASAAHAAAGPSSDLSVTSPPTPVPAAAGSITTSTLRVGNLGLNPLDVQITPEGVQLLDNGATRFVAGVDPRFAGRITIKPSRLSLPARQERTVTVTVKVPKGLAPDDYFLGFLVSPVIGAASVTVQNDIGALVVLDVPGPRTGKLAAHYIGLPRWSWSLSSSTSGAVQATNFGTATVQFATTLQTSGWPSPAPRYRTVPVILAAPGLARNVPVHVSSWLGIGRYTIHTTLVYDLGGRTTGQVTLSRTVTVVNPLWLLTAPAAALLVFQRRRARRRRATGVRPTVTRPARTVKV